MTDEEIAYEYAKYDNNGRVSVNDDKFKGFLAGLEAGRPKWHKVADGDFPKDGETVLVCRDDMQIWTGNRHSKRENSYFWYIHNLYGVLYKDSDVIAWCEIPKYTEE